MAWPTPPLNIEVSLALGADLSAAPSSWSWTNVTSKVYFRDGVRITRGRGDEDSQSRPATCRLTFDNRDGRFFPRNPTGTYYGQIGKNTPLRVRVNPGAGMVTRFVGYVNEWPPAWDPSETDHYVTVEAKGILQRLGQGDAPLRSPIWRATEELSPEAYWSLEDESGSLTAGSAIVGRKALTASNVSFASDSTLAGSQSLAVFSSNETSSISGPAGISASTFWAVSIWMRVHDPVATDTFMRFVDLQASGSESYWEFTAYGTITLTPSFQVSSSDGAGIFLDGFAGGAIPNPFDGEWHHVVLTVTQNGGNIDTQLFVDGASAATDSTAGTIGKPTHVMLNPRSTGVASAVPMSLGHLALHDSSTGLTGLIDVATGYAGEISGTRFARLCGEEGVTDDVTSGSTDAMGAQTATTLLNLLRECESAEAGLIVERLTGELGFDPHVARENQSVDLTLNYASQHIHPPLEPTDDDRYTRNDITVFRQGGSSARAVDTGGPLGTATIGIYDDRATLNVKSDDRLPHHAGWRLHLGTVDETRYPQVRLNLRRNSSLVTSWLACDIGSRVQITNLPDIISYDTADLIIEGYTEYLDSVMWTVELICAPYKPYLVATWGPTDPNGAGTDHYDALDSETTASFTAGTSTSMSVATNSGPLWTTDADDFPFNIRVSGVELTVTNITGSSSPQTFTITQTPVNGVAKVIASGSAVVLAKTPIYAL